TVTAPAPTPTVLDPQAQAVLDRLGAGHTDATTTASPLPADLEAARRRHTVQPGAQRGPER
ncbi:relaxase, partial [Cellulosimicrobium terreum]|nr:relaxase [Cellulosimicrobium terreum]